MLKTILFSLLLAASIAFAAEKNEDFYVDDCDSYGQLAYSTAYLRHHAVTFEDGVKRLMTREEFVKRFNDYIVVKSKIAPAVAEQLLTDMLDIWDNGTTDDPVDLYTDNRAKCEKSGKK